MLNKVLIPNNFIKNKYIGKIYGKYIEETGVFNVFDHNMISSGISYSEIGEICDKDKHDNKLIGVWRDNVLSFTYNGESFSVEEYGLIQNVFSRNAGILETDKMLNKTAIIIGCGSVGSLVAVELAKSGVGTFVLVDSDIVEYHNLCRHQCDIEDVGKYKVDAVKEILLRINPSISIFCERKTIENISKDVFDEHCLENNTIIIGCADNRMADSYTNGISVMYKVPFVSIGFWERAFAGEIFYYLPNKKMPCYKCAIGEGNDISGRVSKNRRFYTNEEDIRKVNFEPGISSDISFVTIVGIKIIIDILNMDSKTYIPRLINSLRQYTLVCNTNNPQIGGEMAEIFAYPLQVTTSLVVSHSGVCPPCEYE